MSLSRPISTLIFVCMSLGPLWAAASARAELTGAAIDVAGSVGRTVDRVGRELGHGSLLPDARLQAAAGALAKYTRDCGEPARALIEASLWQSDVVEPVHRLMLIRYDPAAPQDMLDELPARLRALLGKRGSSGGSGGRWARYGFASAALPGGERCGAFIALETFVTLQPMPHTLPVGGTAPLKGELRPPYSKPRALVTPPTGDVQKLPLALDKPQADGFRSQFTCRARGRYQLEILGEYAGGPTVLAKFPCHCGEAPPSPASLAGAVTPAQAPNSQRTAAAPAEAEQQLFRMINDERSRAGRLPLVLDERLAAVARAHSEDMHRHQFVAHISPRTGSPGERVKRAGIVASRVTENLAKAADPFIAHRELMESPGHRASILDPDVRQVGVGVVATRGLNGEPWLMITQLFATLSDTSFAFGSKAERTAALERAMAHLATLRRAAGLGILQPDPALVRIAEEIATGLTTGRLQTEQADQILGRSLPSLAGIFLRARLALVEILKPDGFGPVRSLMEPSVTHVGMALATLPPAPKGAAPRAMLVFVLGQR